MKLVNIHVLHAKLNGMHKIAPVLSAKTIKLGMPRLVHALAKETSRLELMENAFNALLLTLGMKRIKSAFDALTVLLLIRNLLNALALRISHTSQVIRLV